MKDAVDPIPALSTSSLTLKRPNSLNTTGTCSEGTLARVSGRQAASSNKAPPCHDCDSTASPDTLQEPSHAQLCSNLVYPWVSSLRRRNGSKQRGRLQWGKNMATVIPPYCACSLFSNSILDLRVKQFLTIGTKKWCLNSSLWRGILGNRCVNGASLAKPEKVVPSLTGCQTLCLLGSKWKRFESTLNWSTAFKAPWPPNKSLNPKQETMPLFIGYNGKVASQMFSIKARRAVMEINGCLFYNCQSRTESLSVYQHTRSPTLSLSFPVFCQQVLCGRQVFPKEQHDFVSNGLWGGAAERELRDTGPIVAPDGSSSWPHTYTRDVLLHLDRDKRLLACNTF